MRAIPCLSWLVGAILSLISGLASATIITYTAILGPEAVGATGTGTVSLAFDDSTNDLSIAASFSGLSGMTTVAHIHCCTVTPFTGVVGVAVTPGTLPGFPANVTSGSHMAVIDLDLTSSFSGGLLNANGGTVAGATAALLAGLDSGKAYFNIHTSTFPAGEIRGFPQQVPEPVSLLLAALGVVGLILAQRGRHRR